MNVKPLTKGQLLYAIQHTVSNRSAALFLGVAYNTYKRYASLYRDEATGKTLFEIHKNQQGQGISKGRILGRREGMGGYYRLIDLLEGTISKTIGIGAYRLKNKILKAHILEEQCDLCGFNEHRITDNTVPLLLDFIDGNRNNYKLENLRFLCYNCYYLTVDNLSGKKHPIPMGWKKPTTN